MTSRQKIVMIVLMTCVAGFLLMTGDNGAGIIFFIGLGLVFLCLTLFIVIAMWKIAVGADNAIGKHL